jgi:hydrogenase/urease accessory protein HupE
MKRLTRAALLAGGLVAAAPSALWAHAGHAGDHGWLMGALQPLLSLDHLLAGVFVALVLTLGLARVARSRGLAQGRRR